MKWIIGAGVAFGVCSWLIARYMRIAVCPLCGHSIFTEAAMQWHSRGECRRATDQMNEEYGDD
jgi:hypothetical protein